MVEISTSILSVKENATQTFYDLEVAGTDYYHIDVMDGKFVEANTEDKMMEYSQTIKHISNLPLDVHLMVEDVKGNIDKYIPLEPQIITFHYEACKDKEKVKDLIEYIKENNIKCGLSIKPNTKTDEILEFLPYIYLVLVMTVEPGKGGQKLIPETIEKVKKLKAYITKNNLDTYIEVDGGVKLDTVNQVKIAGADILVSGSGIINSENFKETIEKMKE